MLKGVLLNLLVLNESNRPSPTDACEKRCAVTPTTVKRYTRLGLTVYIEKEAGIESNYSDESFIEQGATIVNTAEEKLPDADIVLYVNRPQSHHIELFKPSALIIGHIDPFFQQALVESLAQSNVSTLSVEMIPRSSRAQKMDALSSQASLAGYVMMMQAANALPSILPMMMTPSGTIKPAKVFVIGAGVAGLQAIATAKRLGANVLAYDTRDVVAEQVESLGAKFLSIDIGESGQTKDGYAKALTDEQKAIQQNAQRDAIVDADIVITTAQLFGRKPPVLITKETLKLMKPGSVVVDMAATSGGNVEGSISGKTIALEGVTVIGDGHWSQRVAKNATDMYANNLLNLIEEFFDAENTQFTLNLEDEILAQSVITHNASIVNEMLINAYSGE